MKKSTKWFLGIMLGLVAFGFATFVVFYLVFVGFSRDDEGITTTSGRSQKVAVIELRGTITSSEEIVRQFKKFRERRDVKAILFRVDSPGGGVAASQEIYEEVRRTREKGTPVVVSMGAVAASGGYYVACGADRIVANRGTITGSIGVISQFLRFDPMLQKLGIEATTIKSGKLKDTGSPFREMTKQDKAYLQDLMDDVHRQFISVVETHRGLAHGKAIEYSDGRVFTGEQALAAGLIDTLGTFEDALMIAAGLGGIEGEPGIVKERKRRSLVDLLRGEVNLGDFLGLKEEILSQPILQYRLVHPF